jgi:glutaredoxin
VSIVTILTQDACAFCDEAKRILDRLGSEFPLRVEEVGLDTARGRELAETSGMLFPPGILIDGEPFAYGRPSERRLRRELRRRTASA